jgi:AraC-like DNA-binding protein
MPRVRSRRRQPPVNEGLARLLQVCDPLPFEPHDIARHLDERRHYGVPLGRDFPLLVKLFHYSSRQHTPGPTWHERLELFLALDGEVRLRMGDQLVTLAAGDLLVVDNLKLHGVADFAGFDARVVVTSFLPELVYSLGSPAHDYVFLLPFYSRSEGRPRVIRTTDAASSPACSALARLVACVFDRDRQYYEAGSKAFLLETLYHVARHFSGSGLQNWELVRQQQRSLRLKGLFEHIREHHAEKIPVRAAARLAGMSSSQFMKAFRRVAGMTLVRYLNHVRLARAVSLLRDTDLKIAEIATEVGFADQSYFDRRFRQEFGRTPRSFRARSVKGESR